MNGPGLGKSALHGVPGLVAGILDLTDPALTLLGLVR